MQDLVNLVLLFFVYAFLGWCMEVTLKFIQYHRFINRGFLTGPVCPIYGFGAAAITVMNRLLSPLESAYGTTFAASLLLCGLLEYFCSYFLEKRFHARWWDYSRKPMNLHGRVWIGNLILFGLGGVIIIHLINPLLSSALENIPLFTRELLSAVLVCILSADYVVTHFILKLIKNSVEHSDADNTEEIRREVHLMLSDRNIFYRRFANAYPDVVYRTEKINARLDAIRKEAEKKLREAEMRRAQLASSLEPSFMIRSTVMENQARLISLMYDESRATEEMRKLKHQIDKDQERLKNRSISRIANR